MKECIDCLKTETAQWYTGPLCKSCYNKRHRVDNLEQYVERDKKYYQNNSEYVKDRQNLYYQNNRETCKEKSKAHKAKVGDQHREGYFEAWRAQNPDKCKAYNEKYKKLHPDKVRESQSKYVSKNLHIYKFRAAKRRAKQLGATPTWLSTEQTKEIKTIYKNCPEGYHVDHIVPLQGKNVSGLHVPWNLQYLPAAQNIRKSNKL